MSTNPTPLQTAYQRVHRARKREAGVCQENGCQNETACYRCAACAHRHAERERNRQRGVVPRT